MATTDIGGLFVKLGLHTDKNSFSTGNRVIDTLTAKTSQLIGTVRNAGAAMFTMAAVTGSIENASIKTSAKLGIATEKLNMWKAAAQIAGSSSDGLVASMTKLNDAIVNRKIDGKGIAELSKYYELMGGKNLENLFTMNSSDAFAEFMNVAMASDDVLQTAELLNRALGSGASEFYLMLKESGNTLDDMLDKANKTQFTTSADTKNGKTFNTEVGTLKAETASIAKLFGDTIGKELTPLLKDLNNWIQTHGDEIRQAAQTTAEVIRTVAEGVLKIVDWIGEKIGGVKDKIEQGQNKADMNTYLANKIVSNGGKLDWKGQFSKKDKLNYEELSPEEKSAIDALGGKSKFAPYINDGIIRPNGQVTQVAPDDWIFAARNIGDLASAFIPQNYGTTNNMNAPASYVINQTFNVNGNGNLAQTIRQQAYNGTRDGLMQVASQSTKRLQMMSGTR